MARHMKKEPGPEVELPITPMLDMAFQILVFFIFTYHPSAFEVQIDGTLLPPDTTVKAAGNQTPPKEQLSKQKPPDTGEDLVVLVEAVTAHDLAAEAKKLIKAQGPRGLLGWKDQEFDDWLDWELRRDWDKKNRHYANTPPLPLSLKDAPLPFLPPEVKDALHELGTALGTPKQIYLQPPNPTDDATDSRKLIKEGDARKPRKLIHSDEDWEQVKKIIGQNLKAYITENLESLPDAVVIYVKDVNLKWGYFIEIWDLCKARYGVPPGKVKELVKIETKKQEKEYTRIVGFKNVSYLIPAKKLAPAPAKKE